MIIIRNRLTYSNEPQKCVCLNYFAARKIYCNVGKDVPLAMGPLSSYLHQHLSNPDYCAIAKIQMFCAPQCLCKAYAAENLSNGSFDNEFFFVWVIRVSLHLNCCKDHHRYLLALLQHADMNTEPAAVKNLLILWDDNIIQKLFCSETIVKVECSACKVVLESSDHWLNLFKWLGISWCAKQVICSLLWSCILFTALK